MHTMTGQSTVGRRGAGWLRRGGRRALPALLALAACLLWRAPVTAQTDSLTWVLRWSDVPGATGYDVEWDTDVDDAPDRGFSVGTTEAALRVSYGECGDTARIQARVRATGNWRGGTATAWSAWAAGATVRLCPLPDPPEPVLDTVATVSAPTMMVTGTWRAETGEYRHGDWNIGVGESVAGCWYEVDDAGIAYRRWPASCPDEGVVTAGPTGVIPDTSMRIGCGTMPEPVSVEGGVSLECRNAAGQLVMRWVYDPDAQGDGLPQLRLAARED